MEVVTGEGFEADMVVRQEEVEVVQEVSFYCPIFSHRSRRYQIQPLVEHKVLYASLLAQPFNTIAALIV